MYCDVNVGWDLVLSIRNWLGCCCLPLLWSRVSDSLSRHCAENMSPEKRREEMLLQEEVILIKENEGTWIKKKYWCEAYFEIFLRLCVFHVSRVVVETGEWTAYLSGSERHFLQQFAYLQFPHIWEEVWQPQICCKSQVWIIHSLSLASRVTASWSKRSILGYQKKTTNGANIHSQCDVILLKIYYKSIKILVSGMQWAWRL